MKLCVKPLKNEDGSVIVFALLILVAVSIIGISATNTTTLELQIAANDQFHKMAFYTADSGIYATPKLISYDIDEGAPQNVAAFSYLVGDTEFYRQIMGYDTYDAGDDIGVNNAAVDVERLRQQNLAGGGAEFAGGSEGIGVGSASGVAIFYGLDSDGLGPRTSRSDVYAVYRKVIGMAGGL